MEDQTERHLLYRDPRAKADPGPALSQAYGREYRITVRGRLADDWSDWFDGLRMTTSAAGDTVLSGTIVDQSALMGVLNKLNRLNVTLLSLSQMDDQRAMQTKGEKNV